MNPQALQLVPPTPRGLAAHAQSQLWHGTAVWPGSNWLRKELNCEAELGEALSWSYTHPLAQETQTCLLSSGPCPWSLLEVCLCPAMNLLILTLNHLLDFLASPGLPGFVASGNHRTVGWPWFPSLDLLDSLVWVLWGCAQVSKDTACVSGVHPQLLAPWHVLSSLLLLLSHKNIQP